MHADANPDERVFVNVLKACSSIGRIEQGKWVHSHIMEKGLESDPYVSCTLIDMYVKYGSLEEAHSAFDTLPVKPVETWNALIAGYAYQEGDESLKLFKQMQLEGVKPSRVTFICILKACSSTEDLEQGRHIHALSIESGFEFSFFVGNTLIDMYVNCDSLVDAHVVFARSSTPDISSCNTLVGGYAQFGSLQEALSILMHMHKVGIQSDQLTFVGILKACSNIESLQQGRDIHAQAIESGLGLDELVSNSLMHMYTCCESFEDAEILFDKIPMQNVVTWSTLMACYAHSGQGLQALELLGQMRHQGIEPNQITFINLLKGCSNESAFENGRIAHIDVVELGFEGDLCVGNALIDMYGKCGRLEDANTTFCRMPSKNVVTWTALIGAYSQCGHVQEALLLLDKMQNEGLKPNPVTFASLLKACSSQDTLHEGRHIHACVVEAGLEFDAYVSNSLLDMYFECCCPDDALEMFNRVFQKEVVMWNTLISGYVRYGECFTAVQCYQHMRLEGLVRPDPVTYICVLKGCIGLTALTQGISIHSQIIGSGFLNDICVGSVLIDMYIKCGCLKDACRLFSGLPERNVVTWNMLLRGFAESGQGNVTLQLFWHMQEARFKPDTVTLLCAIKACCSTAAVQQGRLIHTFSIKWGLDMDISFGNTLIDMYASCGSMNEALAVFDKLPIQDIVSWSALMTGYAQHNDYLGVLRCYESMQQSGHKPDVVTLNCVLSACSRGGLVQEGFLHFKSIREVVGVQPTIELYNPLVDLLGGVAALHEAEDLLETIPFPKNTVGWSTLLAASRKHCSQDVGRRCFDRVVQIDPSNAAAYVIMSSIYSRATKQREAQEVEELRRLANAWKKPAKAFIEINSRVHEFLVGDQMHPASDAIYSKLRALSAQVKEEGYKPHLDLVLNLPEEDKEMALCGHSEKLAIAFGLISTSPCTSLRVAKNLRMCSDCHVTAKLISKIEKRNIVVKDTYCIHEFHKGLCSCEE